MKTTLHPITVRDLYAGFADRGGADSYDRAWTSPHHDLWPPGVEPPDGFFYDYGGGIMGVPITFLDKWNPEQFQIVDANLLSRGVIMKPHGLIKDKDSAVNYPI